MLDIFDGIIISDGHLSKPTSPMASSRLSMGVKYKSFVEAVVVALPLSWSPITKSSRKDKRTGNIYTTYQLRSHTSAFLREQRDRWYPNGTKIIPEDLILNKQVLLWWYLGDGSLPKRKARPNYRQIVLATNSFTLEDNNRLISMLKDILQDDNVYLENNMIIVARTAITQFAKIIGTKSPVSDYEYKFDFGQYLDEDYWKKSFKDRPIQSINSFRKKHRVRELDFRSKEDIRIKE